MGINLANGVLRFSRNGVHLGDAFRGITGPLVAAVTLASEESKVTIQNRPTVLNMGEYTGELGGGLEGGALAACGHALRAWQALAHVGEVWASACVLVPASPSLRTGHASCFVTCCTMFIGNVDVCMASACPADAASNDRNFTSRPPPSP